MPEVRVAFVAAAPGSGYDGFNRQAAAGLAACASTSGAKISTVSPTSTADYQSQLTLLATENTDSVMAMGFTMAPDVDRTARRFETTHFVLIDAVVNRPNVNSITFSEQEGAFLAGSLAAMVSRTKSVAFIGGQDVALLQKSEAGFDAGARTGEPRVRVRAEYLGSFSDRAAARRVADRLFASGSDVIYVVAGNAGLGAIEAAKARRSAYVIGADSNQDALAPGIVLTSVVKRVDTAALRACLETVAQKPSSGHTLLGLADDGIALTDFRYTKNYVGASRLARLARIRQAIVDGTIAPPASRSELAAFHPPPIP